MGMFDYVRCELRLPDGYETTKRFQSKDSECCCGLLTITKQGRLVMNYDDAMETADTDGDPYGRPDRDVHYHGDFFFYDGKRRFKAKFYYGQLVEIWQDD